MSLRESERADTHAHGRGPVRRPSRVASACRSVRAQTTIASGGKGHGLQPRRAPARRRFPCGFATACAARPADGPPQEKRAPREPAAGRLHPQVHRRAGLSPAVPRCAVAANRRPPQLFIYGPEGLREGLRYRSTALGPQRWTGMPMIWGLSAVHRSAQPDLGPARRERPPPTRPCLPRRAPAQQ